MKSEEHPMDEYTLAAYLAGTLPEARRREVAAYLAQSEDARELLRLAHEALEAAHRPEPPEAVPPRPAGLPAHTPRRRRTPRPAPRERASQAVPPWSRAVRFTTVAVLVVALGVGLRGFLTPSTDTLRGSTESTVAEIKVRVRTAEMSLTWNAVPSTYRYRLVVWDPEVADVVAEHETKAPHVEASDPFALQLREALRPGRVYTLRIDAMDARNRLIGRSDAVALTP